MSEKVNISIRLHRCMECNSLSNHVSEVEVVRYNTTITGEPVEVLTKEMICRSCLTNGRAA